MNAQKDQNGTNTIIGVLNTSGNTTQRAKCDPTTHALIVSDGTGGSNNGPSARALHDENGVTTLLAVSSVDGVTPVALYVDSSGALLIQST